MRNLLMALLAAMVSLPGQAAVTVYTSKDGFLAAIAPGTAVQYDWPDLGEGAIVGSPASTGRAMVSASQLVSYHDGFYADQVYVATSGPQSPDNPASNLSGTVTISTTDNFLGLDLGSHFTPDIYQYVVNGEAKSIDLSSGDITFIGFTDSAPITAAFAENGSDELDVLHTYTSEVPEPANWAMMIAGLGMIGAMTRKRAVRFI